jgi:hypothetical protein
MFVFANLGSFRTFYLWPIDHHHHFFQRALKQSFSGKKKNCCLKDFLVCAQSTECIVLANFKFALFNRAMKKLTLGRNRLKAVTIVFPEKMMISLK